jgi:hypothetical protein
MFKVSNRILSDEREIELKFKGEFDGLQAFEDILGALPPIDSYDRIILDFSGAPRVKPLELHYLLAHMADDPRLKNIEIRVEGLRFNPMANESMDAFRESARSGMSSPQTAA